ncbi:hypothetical protein ScPMuIL_005817 [Solemya velum]
MSASDKKYGLLFLKKQRASVTVNNVFGDDSDDEQEKRRGLVPPQLHVEVQPKLKKQTQIEIDKALADDPTVYDYDAVYDQMKEKIEQTTAIAKAKKEKKSKYIEGLLKTAEKRKIEDERRTERKVQKEREEEGNKFEDKEVFVTSAYKKKMQAMQEAEEAEKRLADMEAKLDVTKQKDLSGFYRYLYNQTTEEPAVKKETEPESSSQNTELPFPVKVENIKSEDDEDTKIPRASQPQETAEQTAKPGRKYRSRNRSSSTDRSVSKSPETVEVSRSRSKSQDESITTSKLSKQKMRSRSRSRSKQKEIRKHQSKHRGEYSSRSRSKERRRHRSRSKSRSRSREKKKQHTSSHDRRKGHSRSKSRSRSRDKKRRHSRSKSRERRKHQSRSKSRERKKHRSRSKSREKKKSRTSSTDVQKQLPKSREDSSKPKKSEPQIDITESVNIPEKEVEKTKTKSEENKYCRHTTEEQLQNARARYLARKLAKETGKAPERMTDG